MAQLKEGSIIRKTTGDDKIATLNDIPTKLLELESDPSHRLVSDAEKTTWNNKQNKLGYTAEDAAKKGSANGYASLDEAGKVPSAQLPSFVDDVLEFDNLSSFPNPGEPGKIYVTTDNNKSFRWSGSGYIEISKSLTLGETAATAFPGDRGKILEDQIIQKADIVEMTYQEYENLAHKKPNTLYLIRGI